LRAAGAGLKVYIGQFLKTGSYSELKALKAIKNITLEQCGRKCFIRKKPTLKDIACAKQGLERAREIIAGKKYRVVILDEINVAMQLGLLKTEEIIEIFKRCPKETELVLTGRNAPKVIQKAADLVSEIKEIKHYFKIGIEARKGIEC
ncbi:MAG: cob(I)yrinic acid a,c-diamide adenosyltransferase, partial [Candidatus Omnitrophota bacterium]